MVRRLAMMQVVVDNKIENERYEHMKSNVVLKTVVVILITALLSVGNMFAQQSKLKNSAMMQLKVSIAQTKAANSLAQAEAQIQSNPALAAIYPPGCLETLAGIADGTLFPSSLMSVMRLSNSDTQADQPQPAVQSYGVIDLGAFGSGAQSYAYGINNDGTVVGTSTVGSSYTFHAFKYSNHLLYDISSGTDGIVFNQANAINNNDEIVGYGTVPANNNRWHALRYSNGTVQDLTPSRSYHCVANSINNLGQVAGYGSPEVFIEIAFGHGFQPDGITFNQSKDAFLITGGVMKDLGTIDGDNYSEAYGVNDSGLVVGSSWASSQHAFSYSDDGPMIDLDDTLGGNDYSVAYGVNNHGQVTGVAYNGFIYDTDTDQTTDLGALGDPDNISTGFGINNSGVTVGTVYINSMGDNHAFVYSGGAMQDLNSLIDPASGWDLQYAMAINDLGQIVGYGINSSGQTHAFLLNPYSNLSYVGFHQGGNTASGVPVVFGYADAVQYGGDLNNFDSNGRAYSVDYGCAMCSVATMLTTLPGLESMTAAQLDTALTSIPEGSANAGYNNGNAINWKAVGQAVGYPIDYAKADSKQISDPAALEQYLEDHCWGNRYRVILQLEVNGDPTEDHFVVVVGKTLNDWILFDPGWTHAYVGGLEDDTVLSSLNAHYVGFTTHSRSGNSKSWQFSIKGVRTFSVGTSSAAYVSRVVHSPVEILVTDPNGNRAGYDPNTGTDVFEIPGASYVRDFSVIDADENSAAAGEPSGVKTLCIPSPSGGTYSTALIGTAAGSYTLDSSTYWPGNSQTSQTTTGTTDVGIVDTSTSFVIVPAVITASASSGGVFNLTFTSQATVTYVVEGVSSLTDTNWASVQTITATGAATSVSLSMTEPMMFYRVRSQ